MRAVHTLERPWLRVANVYRSRLDLSEIKTIRLAEAELERTRLKKGDLLIVEGHGNPQEVGRVATWDASLDDCTHQNHLICVGRTTSGLSTISTRNVKNAGVILPPIELQIVKD